MTSSEPMPQSWHIAKDSTGQCQIIDQTQLEALPETSKQDTWGPFESQGSAIAKRVGLIRAGKCKPT